MFLAAVGIPLRLRLGQTDVERALMIMGIVLTPIVEILNSALEAVVDKASPERHELAERAKDMGGAACFGEVIEVFSNNPFVRDDQDVHQRFSAAMTTRLRPSRLAS